MARYEYNTRQQSNVPLGETFKMAVRAPAVANRIFNTLDDAQSYVDDELSNATAGIRITVINDRIPSNNGLYYVKSLSYLDGGACHHRGWGGLPQCGVKVSQWTTLPEDTAVFAPKNPAI